MIIDTHAHIWPEKIAEKAGEHLEKTFNTKIACVPTPENLLRHMDANGIDITFVSSVATRPEQVPAINKWLKTIVSPRIKVLAAFHPLHKDWQDEMKRSMEFASGIKLQPEFQEFYVDDEKVFPVYEKLQELKLPVLFHCGKELSGTMLVRSGPQRMASVNRAFPEMKIIAAHFGGFQMWDEVERDLLGRDMYLDTAFTFKFMEKNLMEYFIQVQGEDLVLFGTDFPLVDQKPDIDYLKSLDLPEESKNKIFYANAKKLFNLP